MNPAPEPAALNAPVLAEVNRLTESCVFVADNTTAAAMAAIVRVNRREAFAAVTVAGPAEPASVKWTLAVVE